MADEELSETYFELIPLYKFQNISPDDFSNILNILKLENISSANFKIYKDKKGNNCFKFYIFDKQRFLVKRLKYGF